MRSTAASAFPFPRPFPSLPQQALKPLNIY